MHTTPGFIGSHVPPPPDELELLDELDELELLDELDELDELDPDELDALDELDDASPLDPDELDAPLPDPAVPLEEAPDSPPVPFPDELLLAPLPPPVSPSSVSCGAPSKVDPSAQWSKNNDVRPKKRGSASFFTIDDRTWQVPKRK